MVLMDDFWTKSNIKLNICDNTDTKKQYPETEKLNQERIRQGKSQIKD